MKKSMKIVWESFSDNGQRFVRETVGEKVTIIGPLHMYTTFTGAIRKRESIFQATLYLHIAKLEELTEQEKRRNALLKEFIERGR